MKILYLANILLASQRANSIQVLNTCAALARRGAATTLVVREPPGDLAPLLAGYGIEDRGGLTLEAALGNARGAKGLAADARFVLACVRRLARRAPRPDVVLTRDALVAWTLLRLRPALGVPVVYESHGVGSVTLETFRAERSERKGRRLDRREGTIYRTADGVVFISESLRSYVAGRFRLDAPSAVVHDGAPPPVDPLVPPAMGAQATESSPAGGERVVLYLGQPYAWKGVDLAVEALRSVAGVRLRIVGGSYSDADRDIARLGALAASLGVADRVDLAGPVAPALVREELGRAWAGVVPIPDNPIGRHFNSPLKLFEYMAAGLPVIASDLPTIREIAKDGENALLFRAGDPADLARAIARLLADPGLAKRIRERGLETARAHTWDARAEAILAFLRGEVVRGRPGRGGASP